MGWTRADLTSVFGKVRERRWVTGTVNGPDQRHVSAGRLADGKLFVEPPREPAFVFAADAHAEVEALLARLMADGVWRPCPASYDARQQPCDGGRWVKRGQSWEPAD